MFKWLLSKLFALIPGVGPILQGIADGIAFVLKNILWFAAIFGVAAILIFYNHATVTKLHQDATIAAQQVKLNDAAAEKAKDEADKQLLSNAINKLKDSQTKIDTLVEASKHVAQGQTIIEDTIHNVPVTLSDKPFTDPGLSTRIDIMRNYQQSAYPLPASTK